MPPLREQAGLPKGPEMREVVLELMRELPMPVSRAQLAEAVAERLELSEEQRAVRGASWGDSYIQFYAGWACNDLKWAGATEQPGRGLYQLSKEGLTIKPEEVERRHRERARENAEKRKQNSAAPSNEADLGDDDPDEPEIDWQEELLTTLRGISPAAFEHLSAALLRSAGFDDVEVTGRSGDGGIDGIGVYRPAGLISFHTAFQCKRYQGSVGAGTVRDFRGAFIGQSDRGIIITTGAFTKAARDEASKAGAPPVDLIDGEALCELLREHSLGVRTTERVVEDITIDDAYFAQFEDSP